MIKVEKDKSEKVKGGEHVKKKSEHIRPQKKRMSITQSYKVKFM